MAGGSEESNDIMLTMCYGTYGKLLYCGSYAKLLHSSEYVKLLHDK